MTTAMAEPTPITGAELAANIVAKLAIDGFLGRRQMVSACHSVSVPVHLVDQAVAHIHQHGYRAPSLVVRLAPPAVEPEPVAVQAGPEPQTAPAPTPSPRPVAFPDGSTTRLCRRCGETKPIDQYRYVSKGRKKATSRTTYAWQSWCKPCWSAYQQERYLSAAREAALASVGLTLAGDTTNCVVCGQPIDGQAATTITINCHARCLEDHQ